MRLIPRRHALGGASRKLDALLRLLMERVCLRRRRLFGRLFGRLFRRLFVTSLVGLSLTLVTSWRASRCTVQTTGVLGINKPLKGRFDPRKNRQTLGLNVLVWMQLQREPLVSALLVSVRRAGSDAQHLVMMRRTLDATQQCAQVTALRLESAALARQDGMRAAPVRSVFAVYCGRSQAIEVRSTRFAGSGSVSSVVVARSVLSFPIAQPLLDIVHILATVGSSVSLHGSVLTLSVE